MRKLTYLLLLALVICALGTNAAEPSLLPDQFGAWNSAGPSKLTSGQSLKTWLGADPRREVLREAGVTTIEERAYRNGNDETNLTLFIFKDPTGAYQYFTQATSINHRAYALGDEAAFDASTGNILIGNLVVTAGSAT